MSDKDENQSSSQLSEPRMKIERIYLKDVSFETPNSPEIFRQMGESSAEFSCDAKSYRLEADVYEVVLTMSLITRYGEKSAYVVDLQQAGIFAFRGFDQDSLKSMLASTCASILFPYGREAIAGLVRRGGFPQFIIAHIDFDELVAKHGLNRKSAASGAV